jgi:hypothetical protein
MARSTCALTLGSAGGALPTRDRRTGVRGRAPERISRVVSGREPRTFTCNPRLENASAWRSPRSAAGCRPDFAIRHVVARSPSAAEATRSNRGMTARDPRQLRRPRANGVAERGSAPVSRRVRAAGANGHARGLAAASAAADAAATPDPATEPQR